MGRIQLFFSYLILSAVLATAFPISLGLVRTALANPSDVSDEKGEKDTKVLKYSLRTILLMTPKQMKALQARIITPNTEIAIEGFTRFFSSSLVLMYNKDYITTRKLVRELRRTKDPKKRKAILDKYRKAAEKERDTAFENYQEALKKTRAAKPGSVRHRRASAESRNKYFVWRDKSEIFLGISYWYNSPNEGTLPVKTNTPTN